MLQANLKAEDGAEFFARIEPVEGQFRASCPAQLDNRHSVATESPDYMMCATVEEAEQWIEREAGRRGFRQYKLLKHK